MIVPMKHLTLLCVAEEREKTLHLLRASGSVHLNIQSDASPCYHDAHAQFARNQRAQHILNAAIAEKPVIPAPLSSLPPHTPKHAETLASWMGQPLPELCGTAEEQITTVIHLSEMRQSLVNEGDRLARQIALIKPFGSFDVALLKSLISQGLEVTLFRCPEPVTVPVLTSATENKICYCVQVGTPELPPKAERIPLPDADLATMEDQRTRALAKADEIGEFLKGATHTRTILLGHEHFLRDQCTFITAMDTLKTHGPVVWITGWCPADQAESLRQEAQQHAWGLLLRDPEDSEIVPTLLRPYRWLQPMLVLFKALGISPSYHEADVSLPFFAFFSIFFAMLVGDGGYGAIILALALWGRTQVKSTPMARAPFTLLTIFSVATITWGALSNTWFGFHPAVLSNGVSEWLSAPGGKGDSNMMLICFTLGVIHLSIARVWNAMVLFPDTKFLAQVGWVGVIWFMYFLAGNIVGVLPMPFIMKIILGISILLIACFMLKRHELKAGAADLGMLPLNIISCLGDIISYVRLFAVGLAGVKVAENFNEMALSIDLPIYIKIVPIVLILLLGHALNFAMAGLSVLVHAVRLNTLEFSNHKGISWAGIPFTPFRKTAGIEE
jgi:V/A-type H+/Na+-transporting ATPase subunit I